ncbi:metallophosphoesterase [Antrihabitans stalactiti]|uniref:Phosphodiesterase n=1 Tax=Antrihabitans stalactiti TaxID=2584121 RepID=A0A848KHH7_9NOCA|nr:metallophosphoesterase [Antrihabitans stalactiti]NMN96514.1 phosphodiesterase [Antrihabitans stalactiti]
MLVLAHVSDPHFDGSTRSVKRASRVMKYLNGLPGRLDAILVTGDIADSGRTEQYRQARSVFNANIPILSCPGNHDDRTAFARDFLGEPNDGPINRVHMIGDALIAMCDSSIPCRPEGLLDDETLTWLESVIDDAPPTAPILIAFHHPPVQLFSPIVDPIRLRSAQRLADLIKRTPRVAGLFCGHAHTSAVSTFAGVPIVVGPSITSVLGPEWEGDDITSDPVVDYGVPPSLAFHVLDDDGRLTTHFRTIPKPGSGKGRGFHRSAMPECGPNS